MRGIHADPDDLRIGAGLVGVVVEQRRVKAHIGAGGRVQQGVVGDHPRPERTELRLLRVGFGGVRGAHGVADDEGGKSAHAPSLTGWVRRWEGAGSRARSSAERPSLSVAVPTMTG